MGESMDLQPPYTPVANGFSTSLNSSAKSISNQEDGSDWSLLSTSSFTDENGGLLLTPDTSVIDESFTTSSEDLDNQKYDPISTSTNYLLDEDPSQWMFDPDHSPEDVEYVDGRMVGGTLAVIVEALTPPDGIVDPTFLSAFFVTFRPFCTPLELADIITARYNIRPPPNISEVETFLWQEQKGSSVRHETLQLTYTWLEQYWQPGVDDPALPVLNRLTKSCLEGNPFPETRILYLLILILKKRRQEKNTVLGVPATILEDTDIDNSDIPKRRITRELLTFLRKKEYSKFSFMDFDSLELARQLTLMASDLFRAITSSELLNYGAQGPLARASPNIHAMEGFSASVSDWVSRSILHELDMKRRTWLVKFFIKIANCCHQLHNSNLTRSVLSALKSPRIEGLTLTMSALPQESQDMLKSLLEYQYSENLNQRHPPESTVLSDPTVPHLEHYMSAISACNELPIHRTTQVKEKQLINLERYSKLAEICQDLRRLQIPYNLRAIPELQTYLKEVAFKTAPHLNHVLTPPVPVVVNPIPLMRLETVDLDGSLNQPLPGPSRLQPSKYLPIALESTSPDQYRSSRNSRGYSSEYGNEPSSSERLAFQAMMEKRELWGFTPRKPEPRQSVSTITTHTSSATIYSRAASSHASSDYGLYYTRRAFSQESITPHEWWAEPELDAS